MQKLPLYVLGLLAVALAGFAIAERAQISDLKLQISALNKTISARDSFVRSAQDAAEKLEKQNKAFTDESAALRNKLDAQSKTNGNPSPKPSPFLPIDPANKSSQSGMGRMVDKLMADPQMLDAVAAQQMLVMKPIYADLVKQLNLSPAETDEFFKLLAAQNTKTMEAGLKLMSGDQKALDDIQATSDDMKTFLGSRSAQYDAYQKTIADRAQLSQISSQMASRNTPLRPDQSTGLLQIMQQEKMNINQFTAANTDPRTTNFDQKAIEDTYNAVAERNARILNRSKTLLTPEQWNALSEQQSQTLQMQKMGMEMFKQ